MEFDYIILGAGSAGCVLANRLSENGKHSVAILEAGGNDNWIWYHIPVGYLYAIGNPRSDWCYKTEPVAGLNGRAINYARGKVIGGCSAINAMIYMRGQAQDYDGWAQMGLTDWSYENCLPAFNKPLSHFKYGHTDKEWRVEAPRMTWKILDDFALSAQEVGIKASDDFNTGDNEGVGYFHINQKMGRRWSAARGYLKPALKRDNLTLFTHTHADKLVLEGKKVTGVIAAGKTFKARREVIVSLGAIASPALLERSGIGSSEILNPLGIDVKHELKGVGENLQDHLQLRLIFKVSNTKTMNELAQSTWQKFLWGVDYFFRRRGALTLAPSQMGAFAKSNERVASANVQFHIQPLSLPKFGDPLHEFNAITVSICNVRPTSRGSVHIVSSDALVAPAIQPNYLSTLEDKQVAIESIKLARKTMNTQAFAKYAPQEFLPSADLQTDEELAKAAGDIGATIFHPVGTCKMGLDEMAVVDSELRVHGLQGLRVIDASVMPSITSGNTNSPTIMIAERGAEMILASS